jgi:hypothetical protein
MSAKQNSLSNFERLLEKASVMKRQAELFQELLFGPQPESSDKALVPAVSDAPSGFFPATFHLQEQIEIMLGQAAQILLQINKEMNGDSPKPVPTPAAPARVRAMPKAQMPEHRDEAYMAKLLAAADLSEEDLRDA